MLALCQKDPVGKDSEVSILITGRKLQIFYVEVQPEVSFSAMSTVQETGIVGLIYQQFSYLCGKDDKAPGTFLHSLMLPAEEKVMVESHWKNNSQIYMHILDLHIYIKVYRTQN